MIFFVSSKTLQTENTGSSADSTSCKKRNIEDRYVESSKTKDLADPKDKVQMMDESLKR